MTDLDLRLVDEWSAAIADIPQAKVHDQDVNPRASESKRSYWAIVSEQFGGGHGVERSGEPEMKPHPYRVGAPSRTIRADQERDRNRQSKPDVREDAAIRAYRRAPQAALDR